MDQLGMILVIAVLLIGLWIALRRDFIAGLSYAVFFWVFMTTFLRISFSGALPELTFHRLMLIVVAGVWLTRNPLSSITEVPMLGLFLFWCVANLISLLGTHIDFVTSLKRFLDFVLELFVFFAVISTSLKSENDAVRIVRAAWLGLLCVAALAVIERYTMWNPVDRFIPGYAREDVATHDILSTYQHRILLGTAVAMGVPLSFGLLERRISFGESPRFFWSTVILLISACYFAFSRGPWLGLAIALVLLGILGSTECRKRLVLILFLAITVMIVRPGVYDTLSGFAHDTADSDSFKGGTFQYRLELWRVAATEVSKSPWTLFFGYGPGAGSQMEVQRDLSYRGKSQKIESWDNHFAYALFQSGLVGLLATLLLYSKAMLTVFRASRALLGTEVYFVRCIFAACAIQAWMMTNVLIFAKQLDYLFWSLIAAASAVSASALVGTSETEPENECELVTETVFEEPPVVQTWR